MIVHKASWMSSEYRPRRRRAAKPVSTERHFDEFDTFCARPEPGATAGVVLRRLRVPQ
jgi:hypothetical protein